MKDRRTLSAAEQQMLQHFRQHQDDEPSASLDARILAAAAAQARQRSTPPSLLPRLQAWLFGGARLRWSLALGSVALLGLGLGLSLRSFERAPVSYDSPMPAAPVLQRSAAPAPQKKATVESARLGEREVGAMADSAATAEQAPAPNLAGSAPARAKAEALAPAPAEVEEGLRQIQRLRDDGRHEQAAARLSDLQQRYPALDIEAQLQRLRAPDETPR